MKRFISVFLAVIISAVPFFCGAFSADAAVYQPDVELYSKAYMLINLDDDSYPVVAQKIRMKNVSRVTYKNSYRNGYS